MNFLSSVRAYLDYVETSVKRKYGNSSSNAEKFKQYCSEAYDNCFSYRFLYRFRNYAQHCGLPLTRVLYNAKTDKEGSANIDHALIAGVDRDDLLNKSFDWGKIKQEISEQPETISINEHVNEMMARLQDIHSKYIADEFVTLRESATLLRGLTEKIPNAVDELHLYRFTKYHPNNPPEKVDLRLQIVPLDLINDVFDSRFAILFGGE